MEMLQFILNNKDYLEDWITRSTYHSNAIEGSTLTYAETYAILYNDNSFKIEGKEPREIYEAINHKKALELVFKNLQDNEVFDERFIKILNESINRDIKDTEGYRTVQVFIQGSEHIPPEPEKVPNLMMYYIYNYNHDEQDIFTKIARYHIEFERIHPFEDGNGRTGRLLINYELLKNNLPPVVIAKEDRVKYFEFLRNNDSNGFAEWLKELSTREEERMKRFGYKFSSSRFLDSYKSLGTIMKVFSSHICKRILLAFESTKKMRPLTASSEESTSFLQKSLIFAQLDAFPRILSR